MTRTPHQSNQLPYYAIRIREHLDPQRAASFDGLAITSLENGETILSGPIADQAALHGLLSRIRDLNLTLIAVIPLEPGNQAAGQGARAEEAQTQPNRSKR